MASSEVVKAKIASLGMSLLQPAAGLAALEQLLAAPALTRSVPTLPGLMPAPAQAAVDVVPFRWRRMLQRYQPLPALFQEVAEEETGSAGASTDSSSRGTGQAAVSLAHRPAAQSPAVASTAADATSRLLVAVKAAVQDVLGREVGDSLLPLHLISSTAPVNAASTNRDHQAADAHAALRHDNRLERPLL
jgi:hypothetical protein